MTKVRATLAPQEVGVMRTAIKLVLVTVACVVVAWCVLALDCRGALCREAWAGTVEPVLEMADQIQVWQPWYSARDYRREHAVFLAKAFHGAAKTHGIDPWLALAIARRESSLDPNVGNGKRCGSRGEQGYFQIMPRGAALKACGKQRNMFDVGANADTAMCYLKLMQDHCPGSTWRWVAAYGWRRCPSEREAREDRATKLAREFYCQAVRGCDRTWPL